MNRLERYIIGTAVCVIIGALCWYFKSIIIYILASAVIAMIGRPIVRKLSSIKIGKFRIPTCFSAIIALVVIFGTLLSLTLLLSPFVREISSQLASLNIESLSGGKALDELNEFIVRLFPAISPDFRIEALLITKLKEVATFGNLSGVITSVANVIIDIFVAIGSICFITFFFLYKEGTFTNILVAALPDKYEDGIRRSSRSINNLLSRYFVGIVGESLGIAVLNMLGLIFIARMNPSFAIVLAFVTGILNVIPYVGPLIGHIISVMASLLVYSSSTFGGSLPLFAGIVLTIVVFTQIIDNYLFQPLIYSSSVKAHPLEIFIVILIGGHIGGMVGMLIAIPSYTVLRVIAGEFLPNLKFVQELTKNLNK